MPRDLGEADELAALVADRVDDDERPEAAAVLAHTPAFGFGPTIARRGLQRRGRHPGRAVLVAVEHAEMLPEDLVRRIALDAPGAGIPRRDDAVGVELEDRIVDHGVHQAAKPTFGVQDLLAGLRALGDVPGDYCAADQLARRPNCA